MGITSNDIAAQRAMLARGEEKRKVAKQAEERERLRDTFAAAALSGLLSNDYFSLGDDAAKRCYELADAMLRERDNHSEKPNSSPTITDAEREAIEAAIVYLQPVGNYDNRLQATLRKLLERLK